MPDANAPAFSIVREPQCSRRHEVGTYTLVRSRSANRSQLLLALSFAALAAAELSNATVAALDGYVRQRFAEESVPGGALSVYVPGNGSLVRTWGIEDVKSNRTFDVRNHVRIASITKSVVGTAILQLVDQGALRLNDTLASLVPIEVPHASAITVEHMLSMTSGLFDYIRDAEFGSAFIADPKTPLSFDTFAAILRRNAPYFEPGMTKAANYCNSNFVLLGEIVARRSGMPLGDYLTERIVKPLNLTETSWPTTDDLPRPYSNGYMGISPDLEVDEEGDSPGSASEVLRDYTLASPSTTAGSGAMISTVGDIRRYSRYLGQGFLLSSESFERRFRTSLPLADFPSINASYALGAIFLGSKRLYRGHYGNFPGYSTLSFYGSTSGIELGLVSNKNGPMSLPQAIDLLRILDPEAFA